MAVGSHADFKTLRLVAGLWRTHRWKSCPRLDHRRAARAIKPRSTHVGNERKREGDDHGLGRVEALEFDGLVDGVHHQSEQDDARGGHQRLVQPGRALRRVGEGAHEERTAAGPGVSHSITPRGDRRHGRLQEEAEDHRSTRTLEQVLPEAGANLRREAVPDQAADDECDDQADRPSSRNTWDFVTGLVISWRYRGGTAPSILTFRAGYVHCITGIPSIARVHTGRCAATPPAFAVAQHAGA